MSDSTEHTDPLEQALTELFAPWFRADAARDAELAALRARLAAAEARLTALEGRTDG